MEVVEGVETVGETTGEGFEGKTVSEGMDCSNELMELVIDQVRCEWRSRGYLHKRRQNLERR